MRTRVPLLSLVGALVAGTLLAGGTFLPAAAGTSGLWAHGYLDCMEDRRLPAGACIDYGDDEATCMACCDGSSDCLFSSGADPLYAADSFVLCSAMCARYFGHAIPVGVGNSR